MIRFDDSNIRRLERDLKTFSAKSLPFAVRNGLTAQASAGKRLWGDEIREGMINRNKFTAGPAIRFERARGLRVDSMESRVGSIADYMDEQEFGGTVSKSGKHGVPIATPYAAGHAMDSRPRKRAVRRPNWQTRIEINKKRKVRGSKKKQNFVAIREAAKSGRGFVYLELNHNRKGIYKVMGGPNRAKIRKVWDLSRPAVRIPAKPTLRPTLKQVEKRAPALYRAALLQQLKRHRLFR